MSRQSNTFAHVLQPALVRSLGTRTLDRLIIQPMVYRLLRPLGLDLSAERVNPYPDRR